MAAEPPPRPSWYFPAVERVADVALAALPVPLRLLDAGCGTGELLRELVVRVPYGERYLGVDPDPAALDVARGASDPRVEYVRGEVTALPVPDASFDLVVTCGSFGTWSDPRRGVGELARVVSARGKVVVVDGPGPRSADVPRPKDIPELLAAAGLTVERREVVARALALPRVRAFIATR